MLPDNGEPRPTKVGPRWLQFISAQASTFLDTSLQAQAILLPVSPALQGLTMCPAPGLLVCSHPAHLLSPDYQPGQQRVQAGCQMSSTWHQTGKAVPGAVGTGGHAPQLNPRHSARDTDTQVLSPGSCLLCYPVGQSF